MTEVAHRAPWPAQVLALAESAMHADGVPPLGESVLSDLRATNEDVTERTVSSASTGRLARVHLVAVGPDGKVVRASEALAGPVLGYAHIDPNTANAEVFVDPGARCTGIGRRLVAAALALGGDDARVWAHGDLPAAAALAHGLKLARVRELLFMARPLASDTTSASITSRSTHSGPPPSASSGLELRPFRPGVDEELVIGINRRAFTHHREQGSLTVDDLRAREQEPWFDPTAFLLAQVAGRVLGFAWLKIVGQAGEIYVLAVDPAAQGHGTGAYLTQCSLDLFAERRLTRAELYVDGDNAAARRTYERAGFAVESVDVQYAQAR